MISKIRGTLSGLSAVGLFLGSCLLLAQPVPRAAPADPRHAAATCDPQPDDETLRFDVQAGLGSVKLNLTLPYYAISRLLATPTES